MHRTVGNDGKHRLGGIADGGACKQACQGAVLLVQLAEHQFHLLTVLGHEVGLPFHQFAPAAAYVVYFLGRQLSHLRRAASRQNLLVHILAWIDGFRLRPGLERLGHRLVSGLGIECQQHPVVSPCHVDGRRLVVEPDGVVLRRVAHADGRLLDRDDAVGRRRLHADTRQAQEPFGVGGKVARGESGLLYLHGYTHRRLRQ